MSWTVLWCTINYTWEKTARHRQTKRNWIPPTLGQKVELLFGPLYRLLKKNKEVMTNTSSQGKKNTKLEQQKDRIWRYWWPGEDRTKKMGEDSRMDGEDDEKRRKRNWWALFFYRTCIYSVEEEQDYLERPFLHGVMHYVCGCGWSVFCDWNNPKTCESTCHARKLR